MIMYLYKVLFYCYYFSFNDRVHIIIIIKNTCVPSGDSTINSHLLYVHY